MPVKFIRIFRLYWDVYGPAVLLVILYCPVGETRLPTFIERTMAAIDQERTAHEFRSVYHPLTDRKMEIHGDGKYIC